MQNKRPPNEKGERHGYWEVYHNNLLWFIANYINDIRYGFFIECHDKKGEYYAR
jgi:hypothetical protein